MKGEKMEVNQEQAVCVCVGVGWKENKVGSINKTETDISSELCVYATTLK